MAFLPDHERDGANMLEVNVEARVKAALADFCESMKTDGLDLVLDHVEGPKVYFRLVVTPEACKECILATDFLESVILTKIQESLPQITTVSVTDSQDSAG
jgi:hypothetical protein